MLHRLASEALDQFLHALIALVIVCLASSGTLLGAGLAGFLVGAIREVTEQEFAYIEGRKLDFWTIFDAIRTSPRDLTFWTLGGILAGLLLT